VSCLFLTPLELLLGLATCKHYYKYVWVWWEYAIFKHLKYIIRPPSNND
jgi:hypothetical protein